MACSSRQLRRREDGAVEPEEVANGARFGRRSFFRIILAGALESGKLVLPKSFLRRYGNDLSDSVLLKVAGSSTWPIELEKHDDDTVSLWKGWREFMDHYSIGHGHFLVFKYKGSSIFRVTIFDKTTSEIEYSLSSGKTSHLGSKHFSPKTEDVIQLENAEDVTLRRKTRIEPHLPYSQQSPSCSRQGSKGPIENDPEEPHLSQAQAGPTDRIREPSTCRVDHSELVFHDPMLGSSLSTPELACKHFRHPFFKKVIPRSYQSKLSIPTEFIKPHSWKKRRATLRYANRSWSVGLIRNNRHVKGSLHLFFSAGWAAFVRETHLRMGNVCVFELIDRDNIVFKVSMFKVQRRNKLTNGRKNDYEPVFGGPTPPEPLTTPEVANEFESEHPFFKVVMQQSHETKVDIPGQFAKKYIQENKEMATLRFSDRMWAVKLLSHSHETRVFSDGWPAFARETHLCVGNMCVFELIDRVDAVFQVSVFSSAGGLEKSACRASRSMLDLHGPSLSRPLMSPTSTGNDDSEHPFFKLVTRKSSTNCLGVPVGFAKQHLLENKQIATLQYSDRSWPVRLIRHRQANSSMTLSFSAGWRAFAKEAHLCVGDVCLFELIDREDTVFRVSILSNSSNDPIEID